MEISSSSGSSPFYTYQNDKAQKGGESSSSVKKSAAADQLNSAELAQVAKLSVIDTKVRAHEAAHIGAGGGVVNGGASYSYAKGPDGKMYAVGGEVPIDLSEGKTPGETVQKARQIVAAAMAPADPSPQDYKVAASASVMELRAHVEETQQLQEKMKGKEAYAQNGLSAVTANEQSGEASPAIP